MEQNTSNLFELHIDHQSNAYLRETAKWARFLAIVGFIICALLVIIALFAGSVIASGLGGFGDGGFAGLGVVVTIFYVLVALLLLFPNLYLFRFGGQMQTALRNNDQALLASAFGNIKSYFKFIGILTIIALAFWALGLVFGVLGSTMSSFN